MRINLSTINLLASMCICSISLVVLWDLESTIHQVEATNIRVKKTLHARDSVIVILQASIDSILEKDFTSNIPTTAPRIEQIKRTQDHFNIKAAFCPPVVRLTDNKVSHQLFKPFIVILDKDTLALENKISMQRLLSVKKIALKDSCVESTKPKAKTIKYRIQLVHNSSVQSFFCASYFLTTDISSQIVKLVPGDKVIIDSFESIWLDASGKDHFKTYPNSQYILSVIG